VNYIKTDKAPSAVGPYSQAIEVNNTLYLSGQLPINPKDGNMPESIGEQTQQSLNNIRAILEKADYSINNLIHCTIYLTDMEDFSTVNEVYGAFFDEKFPTRSCFAVKELPKNASVEIEATAVK